MTKMLMKEVRVDMHLKHLQELVVTEDLVILIADMLMSSSYTKNWAFGYIIIDSNNPLNPQNINHVILYVDDGQYSYFIEATTSPNFDYYPDGIDGWNFPVV